MRLTPALALFDFPEPNVTSELRNSTTIPQQQLFVLNSVFMVEMARAFAERVAQAAAADEDRLRQAWQWAYARLPTADEIALGVEFLRTPGDADEADRLSRWEQLCHALLSSNEFMFVP